MVDFAEMITIKEAAAITGYTPQNITKMIRAGKLSFVRRGRQYFVKNSDIQGIIKVVNVVKLK